MMFRVHLHFLFLKTLLLVFSFLFIPRRTANCRLIELHHPNVKPYLQKGVKFFCHYVPKTIIPLRNFIFLNIS